MFIEKVKGELTNKFQGLSPNQQKNILFAGISLVAFSLIFIFFMAIWIFFTLVDRLQIEVAIKWFTGSATIILIVLGSVISFQVSKNLEKRFESESLLKKERGPIYEELIKFILTFIHEIEQDSENYSREQVLKMEKITCRIMVWGSDMVIKEFLALRNAILDGGDNSQLAGQFENLILAIRKDTGYGNKFLAKGDIANTIFLKQRKSEEIERID
ncbi:hypothetical protein ACFL35_07525 [Candidatus Riflebacteria bacterium]